MDILKTKIKEVIKKHPNSERAVTEVYELCVDEIENGENREHEIELALSAINDIEKELDKS